MLPPPLLGACACFLAAVLPQHDAAKTPDAGDAFEPRVAPASDEGRAALAGFRLAPGLEADLWAAEPLLANPVCFHVNDQGVVYVAESFRLHEGVTDLRNHLDWLDDDHAAKSVEERVAFFRKHTGADFERRFARAEERIRRLVDTDGDGLADDATVFAGGFADPADGIGAGLLEHEGWLYYTCIPNLWRLRDTDGDGVADERQVLSSGYGVKIALLGHDLHGLVVGPLGKLYFSCGDRGFRVETPTGVIEHQHAGAVLRCDPDGSNLEVFATGLRNPQELAFDDHGNLFTGDNNSDGGDRARWVYVVEGGDSGWRYSYQFNDHAGLRGPWNAERLWVPWFEGQAAYLVPPLANLGDGPSGLAFDPGTGLAPEWRGHFFLCDFRGNPTHSGIHAFRVEPKGASFTLGKVRRPVWGTLVTDCQFGPDGALWWTDWVEGWNQTGKGRIYRAVASELDEVERARVADVRDRLRRGFEACEPAELRALLAHPDRRVRQGAQFALARGVARGLFPLRHAAFEGEGQLERLHGIWGLGMLARLDPVALEGFERLLADPTAEVRAQAARTLGEVSRERRWSALLHPLLEDPEPRVRHLAATALARIADPVSKGPLIALLRRTELGERELVHGATLGLAACASGPELAALASDPSLRVRLGAVVALRRMQAPQLAVFLADKDPLVVVEAARAIHDLPVRAAYPALAALDTREDLGDWALGRRVINARFVLGREEDARALLGLAAREGLALERRVEALERLAQWADPEDRDRVMGDWRPIPPREAGFVGPLVAELLEGGAPESWPDASRAALVPLLVQHRIAAGPWLARWCADRSASSTLRRAALRALVALDAPEWRTSLEAALADPDPRLRAAALEVFEGRAGGTELLELVGRVLAQGGLHERRAAYARLAGLVHEPRALELLAQEARRLDAGLVADELALDLTLAIERSGSPVLASLLEERGQRRRAADPELAPWLDALHGGDAARGRAVFERADLACLRCHATDTAAGAQGVGPNLADVGARLTRLALLESIVVPNRHVGAGYESTTFLLEDDRVVVGRVLAEDDERVLVVDAEGVELELEPATIQARRTGLSAMPEGQGDLLTREDLRDLLEYLARLAP